MVYFAGLKATRYANKRRCNFANFQNVKWRINKLLLHPFSDCMRYNVNPAAYVARSSDSTPELEAIDRNIL